MSVCSFILDISRLHLVLRGFAPNIKTHAAQLCIHASTNTLLLTANNVYSTVRYVTGKMTLLVLL